MEYSEIRKELIGSLGKPLGTIMKIEGFVATWDGSKEDEDKIKLRVVKINDKILETEVIITTEVYSWLSVSIPEEGKPFKFIGYETDGMTGIPTDAFEYMPYVATTAYTFSTYFQIIKSID